MTDSLTVACSESLPDLTRDWTQPYTLPGSIAFKTSSIYAFIALLPPSRRQARGARRPYLLVYQCIPRVNYSAQSSCSNSENTRGAVDENLFSEFIHW